MWEAVAKGDTYIVRMLLENGADPMIKDENGNSSLTTAIDKIKDRDTKDSIYELLKKHGADINIDSGDVNSDVDTDADSPGYYVPEPYIIRRTDTNTNSGGYIYIEE